MSSPICLSGQMYDKCDISYRKCYVTYHGGCAIGQIVILPPNEKQNKMYVCVCLCVYMQTHPWDKMGATKSLIPELTPKKKPCQSRPVFLNVHQYRLAERKRDSDTYLLSSFPFPGSSTFSFHVSQPSLTLPARDAHPVSYSFLFPADRKWLETTDTQKQQWEKAGSELTAAPATRK